MSSVSGRLSLKPFFDAIMPRLSNANGAVAHAVANTSADPVASPAAGATANSNAPQGAAAVANGPSTTVATSASTSAAAPRAAAAAAVDYDDELDEIIGFRVEKAPAGTVRMSTRRSTDGSVRTVLEADVQRANEEKLLDYWASFGKPREEKTKSQDLLIYRVLAHRGGLGKPREVLVHWVGYKGVEPDATWEGIDRLLATQDGHHVAKYLDREGLTAQLVKRKPGAPTLLETLPAVAAAADTSGKAAAGPGRPPKGRGRPRLSDAANGTKPAAAAPPPPRKRSASGSPAPQRGGAGPRGVKRERRAGPGVVTAPPAAQDAEGTQGRAAKVARVQRVNALSRKGGPPVAAGAKSQAGAARKRAGTAGGADPVVGATSDAAAPAPGSLWKLELVVEGLPHDDIKRLHELATSLAAQPNAVTIRSEISPINSNGA